MIVTMTVVAIVTQQCQAFASGTFTLIILNQNIGMVALSGNKKIDMENCGMKEENTQWLFIHTQRLKLKFEFQTPKSRRFFGIAAKINVFTFS